MNALSDVIIHVQELKLEYSVLVKGDRVFCTMPLERKENTYVAEDIFFSDIVSESLDRLWPNIGQIQGTYDVALIDLPFGSCLSMHSFLLFGSSLHTFANILLLWRTL